MHYAFLVVSDQRGGERQHSGSGLLERVAAGETEAFEELYDRYAPTLYGLLMKILGNSEDAREVLQEAFVQVWNRAQAFDRSRGEEIAWLVGIARNRGIGRLRSRQTRDKRHAEAGREISLHRANVVMDGDAAGAMIMDEEGKAVRGALSELPEEQRAALELSYFAGLSQSEIAARTGEPLGTIKTRMQLGMRKLRGRLAGMR